MSPWMPAHRCRPQKDCTPAPLAMVDPLERRALLAASINVDGTLVVTGTQGVDEVTLRQGAQPNLLNVQEGTTTLFVFLLDRVKAVSIELGGGDDVLNVDMIPGLLTGATGDLAVRVDGGAGNDSVMVFGVPPGGPLDQVFTVGPDAGGGTLVSSAGTGPAQHLSFAGIESLVDISTAASFRVVGNDGANVAELSSGPLAGGLTPTATVRFFDVTPCAVGIPIVPPGAAAVAAPVSAAATAPPASPTAAVDARDPEARREAKRLAKEAKKQAQRRAKEARLEAKRLAKEARQLARAQKLAQRRGVAAPVSAAASPAPAESFVIDRAHLAVHFANKAAVTVDVGGGADRVDLNVGGAAPAGMQSLALEGGAGDDRLAEQAVPAGVVVQRVNVESSAAARGFVLVTECPPAHVPPIPTSPPPLPPDFGSSAATSSRDRGATSSRNASASRNASSSRNASASRDASSSNDASSSKNASSSRDADAGGSKDRDGGASRDANSSNGD